MKTLSFLNFRTLIAFVLFAFCFSSLHAQSNKGKLRFGLKAGINGANLYDDANASDRTGRTGFVGGTFVKVPLGRRFDLRPELLFITKGGKYDVIIGNDPLLVQHDLKLAYIELPLSLELKLLGFINLHGGVQAAYLVNVDGLIEIGQGNQVNFSDYKDDFERLDYGWHLGGGLDLGKIGLHLRVSRSLNEIEKSNSIGGFVGDLKNSAWALTLSLAL